MIDTALLIAGALAAAVFRCRYAEESELRAIADALYRRIDWLWAQRWRPHDHAGLEAGERFPPLRLGRLQRSHRAVRAGARLADASRWNVTATTRGRRRTSGNIFTASDSVRRATLHSPVFARVDRLSRHPGRVHARKRCDYFENSRRAVRVQREYARRNPAAICRLWRGQLGIHRVRWTQRQTAATSRPSHADCSATRHAACRMVPTMARLAPAPLASLPFAPQADALSDAQLCCGATGSVTITVDLPAASTRHLTGAARRGYRKDTTASTRESS